MSKYQSDWERIKENSTGIPCGNCKGYNPGSCITCQRFIQRIRETAPTYDKALILIKKMENYFWKDKLYSLEDYDKD